MPMSLTHPLHAFWLAAVLALTGKADAQTLPDFTELVEEAGPSVVNIEATRTAEAAARQGPNNIPPEDMPELFRRFFEQQPGMPQMPRDRTSMGTGFIISADGYVLTNHHVIDGADQVIVRLRDRRELEAEVVGSDAQSDVALLKLEESGLPAARIGDSSTLKPGQWMVAIGSPFGFEHSVTAGIVSALGRASQMAGQQYVPFIQTDVPINRGNSGGPLLNIRGEVVGINSQIFSNTGGYMGVSFAIPIEVAMDVVEQLKDKGFVSRGLLGVQIQEVTRDMAQTLGLPRPGGALVGGFSPDSVAEKAGVQRGDVVLKFGDVTINRSSDLPPAVGATRPGTRVDVTVFREGRERVIPVTVGELPREATAQAGGSGERRNAPSNPLGLVVDDLTAEQREPLGLKDGEGVVISAIRGIAGRRAGLNEGDIVLMVGRTSVGSTEEFNDAVKGAKPGEPVMLLIRRGEATQFVTVTPPRED
jgi:serine protease Do